MHENIINRISLVAQGLGELVDQVVFIGGAVSFLYVDQEFAEDTRPTDDIDCIVDVATKSNLAKFEHSLRAKQFLNDSEIICRWHFKGIAVDIIPVNVDVLGFTNEWYQQGMQNRQEVTLPSSSKIYLLQLPYYLATKFEAFLSRGKDDPRQSADLEDIFYIIDAAPKCLQQLESSSKDVRDYLAKNTKTLLQRPDFEDVLQAMLPYKSMDFDIALRQKLEFIKSL